MEVEFPSFSFFLASLLLLLAWKLISHHRISTTPPGGRPLPGPWRLPVIGNMHNLIRSGPPYEAFRRLTARYGPLVRLQLGEIMLVIASSREASAEIMKTHDINFSHRPEFLVGKELFYGCTDIIFSSYGDYWRQARRICNTELLSTYRVRTFRRLREEEAGSLVARVAAAASRGDTIDMKEELFTVSNNVVCKAAFGRSCTHQQQFIRLIAQALELMTGLSIADLFPSIPFLGTLTGMRRKLEKIHGKFDRLLDDIIQEHQEKAATEGEVEEEEDLVGVLLRIKNKQDLSYPITMDNIKAVILDMFMGGTESSYSVLICAMTELMRNPGIRSKAQAEVREVVGEGVKVEEKHIEELKYLGLVMKETLRLHSPGPLLSPRLCKEECQVIGYTIPTGARVFINAWAISRDPRYWDDPETFWPERFEGVAFNFKGLNFEYTPFGSGRRICPGIEFGMATVELTLAQLLYSFDWELPNGIKPEHLEMKEAGGLGSLKKAHLRLLPKPKFSSSPQ